LLGNFWVADIGDYHDILSYAKHIKVTPQELVAFSTRQEHVFAIPPSNYPEMLPGMIDEYEATWNKIMQMSFHQQNFGFYLKLSH